MPVSLTPDDPENRTNLRPEKQKPVPSTSPVSPFKISNYGIGLREQAYSNNRSSRKMASSVRRSVPKQLENAAGAGPAATVLIECVARG